jgi:hypothetical protein
MKTAVVVLLTGLFGFASAIVISHHHQVVVEKVAARLTKAVESSPQFGGAVGVHCNGSQVSVWVLDTLPAPARSQLDRVIADAGKPLKVKLVDVRAIDMPFGGDR